MFISAVMDEKVIWRKFLTNATKNATTTKKEKVLEEPLAVRKFKMIVGKQTGKRVKTQDRKYVSVRKICKSMKASKIIK